MERRKFLTGCISFFVSEHLLKPLPMAEVSQVDEPEVVKVTGEVEDIVKVARAVRDGGADGISLVNTFYGMAIDVVKRKPYLGSIYGGYSGKGIKPLSLYRVWEAAQ